MMKNRMEFNNEKEKIVDKVISKLSPSYSEKVENSE